MFVVCIKGHERDRYNISMGDETCEVPIYYEKSSSIFYFFLLSNMTHGNVLWCFSFHLIHMFSDHSMFHGLVTTPISEVRIEDMEYYTSVWCIFFILVLTFWWLWSCQRKPICPTSCFLFTSLEKLWFRNDIKVDVPETIMYHLETDTGII